MEKTATERLLDGQDGLFAQEKEGEKEGEKEEEKEVGQPKARSANAFLDSLKDKQ